MTLRNRSCDAAHEAVDTRRSSFGIAGRAYETRLGPRSPPVAAIARCYRAIAEPVCGRAARRAHLPNAEFRSHTGLHLAGGRPRGRRDRRTRWLEPRRSGALLGARCAPRLPPSSPRAPSLTDTRWRSGPPARCSCAPMALRAPRRPSSCGRGNRRLLPDRPAARASGHGDSGPDKADQPMPGSDARGRVRRGRGRRRAGRRVLLDDLHGWLPWLVGPLTATVLYLLIASVPLAAVAARER